jgi:hypothetical protein
LVNQTVESFELWSREISYPDYPNNAMRPTIRVSRAALLNPSNEFRGLFGQFVGTLAA